MAKVKISFSIEIEGDVIVEHCVEQEYLEPQSKAYKKISFNIERDFAIKIINKMNMLYTKKIIYSKPWADIEQLKACRLIAADNADKLP